MHDCTLRESGHFTMLCQDHPELTRIFKRTSHEKGVLHTGAIVCEEVNSGFRQRTKRDQLLPESTDCDASRRQHLAQANLFPSGANELHDMYSILCRIGVWHRHHCRVSTSSRCAATRLDGFSFFFAWLAKVGVKIYKSRRDETSGGIDDGQVALCVTNQLNDSISHHDICVEVSVRVDDCPAPQHERTHSAPPAGGTDPPLNTVYNTDIRALTPVRT